MKNGWLFLFVILFAMPDAGRAAFPLGGTNAPVVILLPEHPAAVERFAATELRTYLTKIFGAGAVAEEGAPGRPLLLGEHPENADLGWTLLEPEEFVMDVTADRIRLVGGHGLSVTNSEGAVFPQQRGTLYAVYELLETLGVRWYRPEPWGEFVPTRTSFDLPEGRKTFTPGYRYRSGMNGYCHWNDQTPAERELGTVWAVHNRLNVDGRDDGERFGGFYRINRGHAYFRLVPQARYFAEHPEYFALIDGKRSESADAQLCLSNPDVAEIVANELIAQVRREPGRIAYSIEPNDHSLWCECDACRAMDDPDLKSGTKVSMANRVCEFNNRVAALIRAKGENIRLTWYAYNRHSEVPTRVKKLEGRPMIWAAAYAGRYSDWHRNLTDPASVQNRAFLRTLTGYPLLGADLFVYEYFTGYAWLGPMPTIGMITDRLRHYRDYGVQGVYSMPVGNWGGQHLTTFLATKLLWNPDLDVNRELDLYYTNYFGPAAAPMKRYVETMEAAVPGGPIFYSGGGGLERFFTDALLTKLDPLVAEALTLVQGQAPYERRMKQMAAAHRVARDLRDFQNRKAAGDLRGALHIHSNLVEFVRTAEPGTFENREHGEPLRNFLMGMTKGMNASAAPDAGDRRVALSLDEDWRFLPEDRPDYARPDCELPAKVVQLDALHWWQEQGFETFQGTAWYRKNFTAPASAKGTRWVLRFGAVDGDASVYLEGVKIGEHLLRPDGEGWDQPFEFDITEYIRPGQSHLLAVRCADTEGMSGIFKGVKLLEIGGSRSDGTESDGPQGAL